MMSSCENDDTTNLGHVPVPYEKLSSSEDENATDSKARSVCSDLSEALEICQSLNAAPWFDSTLNVVRPHNFLPIWKAVSRETLELANRTLVYSPGPSCPSGIRFFPLEPLRGSAHQQRGITGRTARSSKTAGSPIQSFRGRQSERSSSACTSLCSPVNSTSQGGTGLQYHSGDPLRVPSRHFTRLGGRRVVALPTALTEDHHWSATPEWTDFVAVRGYLRGPVSTTQQS
jgi:hypothetical protein